MYHANTPTYDISKSWEENYDNGPIFSEELPPLPTKRNYKFLGFDLISPLGVAAGPLPNFKWIDLYAKLGYGSIVHKTVRTEKHASHPTPNVLIVNVEGKLSLNQNDAVVGHTTLNQPVENLSITNSFGNPSPDPTDWVEEVKKEKSAMPNGQLLIVSVYGTHKKGMSLQDLANDYAKAAVMAKEAGAPVIEINLSCPNVLGDEDPNIYMSPVSSATISKTVKMAIGSTPLILKVGYYDSYQKMTDVLKALDGSFDAISSINTISKKVVNEKGEQALPGRDVSGLCGAAIKPFGLETVQNLVNAKKDLGLDFEIIGTGGVMKPEDVNDYLNAGANHVHTATAAMFNPFLAYEFAKAAGSY
jgi:dihydroorotate dehydrogenase (NAD+) catalytic subunit